MSGLYSDLHNGVIPTSLDSREGKNLKLARFSDQLFIKSQAKPNPIGTGFKKKGGMGGGIRGMEWVWCG